MRMHSTVTKSGSDDDDDDDDDDGRDEIGDAIECHPLMSIQLMAIMAFG